METAAGQSCFENLCARESLLQRNGPSGMRSWSSRSVLILTSLLFLLHCLHLTGLFSGEKQSITICQMLEEQGKYICSLH